MTKWIPIVMDVPLMTGGTGGNDILYMYGGNGRNGTESPVGGNMPGW